MSTELAPCPFCGSQVSIKPFGSNGDDRADMFWFACESPSSCKGSALYVISDNPDTAAEQWNRRAPIDHCATPAGVTDEQCEAAYLAFQKSAPDATEYGREDMREALEAALNTRRSAKGA